MAGHIPDFCTALYSDCGRWFLAGSAVEQKKKEIKAIFHNTTPITVKRRISHELRRLLLLILKEQAVVMQNMMEFARSLGQVWSFCNLL